MGRWFYSILGLSLFIGLFPLWFTLAAKYEGRWFPVVHHVEILRIEPETDYSSLIWVHFDKKRDCEYLGIVFYDVTTTPMSRLRVDLRPDVPADDTYSNLPTGEQTAGPWRVYMRHDRIERGLYGVLSHQCFPFYVTRTVWRDPRN